MTALPRATRATNHHGVALIGASTDTGAPSLGAPKHGGPEGDASEPTVHFEFRVTDPQRLMRVREALARVRTDSR